MGSTTSAASFGISAGGLAMGRRCSGSGADLRRSGAPERIRSGAGELRPRATGAAGRRRRWRRGAEAAQQAGGGEEVPPPAAGLFFSFFFIFYNLNKKFSTFNFFDVIFFN